MQKKNILFVIPTLNNGGGEHQTIKMINYLRKSYNIYLLTFTTKIELQGLLELEDDKLFFLNTAINTFSFKKILSLDMFRLIQNVSNIVDSVEPNIVIANLPVSHFVMRIVKFIFKTQYKLINIHHSLQFKAHKATSLMKIFMMYNSYLANRLDDSNIFISNAVKNDQLQLLRIPLSKTQVIYNGVTIKNVQLNCKKKVQKNNNFNIVMAGRFVPEKNHELFLQGILELLDSNKITKQIKVVFLGEGPLMNKIKNTIKIHDKLDMFVFKGNVIQEMLFSEFRNADLVVIPSKSEGFGNVAVEAGLMGAKILSSDVGGLNEVIEHGVNGFKFKSEDKHNLKKELIEIINHKKDLNQDSVKNIMQKRFSFESMIKKYVEVIESV